MGSHPIFNKLLHPPPVVEVRRKGRCYSHGMYLQEYIHAGNLQMFTRLSHTGGHSHTLEGM
jgi:hypothetical protein